jgi:EAL domain-containing protein (putative c-di-GMP-specific phosphodiesterase class I)
MKIKESKKDVIDKNLYSNGIKVAYQPIVDTNSKKILGLEALLRLKYVNPNYSIEDIIHEAENDPSIINEITKSIIKNVINDHKFFVDKNLLTNSSYISINVSPVQLKDDFINLINMSINGKIEFSKIVFEVTETSNLSYDNIKTLNKIINMGIKVAMDDFGTGYSSLFDFINIPYDYVKLDKSLIWNVSNNKIINKIIQELSDITKKSNISVICEGIESKEHEELLIKHGYHIFQGYFYSKPQEKESLIINKEKIFNN